MSGLMTAVSGLLVYALFTFSLYKTIKVNYLKIIYLTQSIKAKFILIKILNVLVEKCILLGMYVIE